MIKALLLIFDTVPTWERIAASRRRWGAILVGYLLPLLLLAGAVEGSGLARWGKPRGNIPHLRPLSLTEVLVFEAVQLALSLITVFVAAKLIKSLGETFHGRHNFTQAFTVAAYGLSPLFLLRMLDAFPAVSPWLSWSIGLVLALAVLYHGLPRIMLPDPPHAFGLFLTSALLLILLTGLICFLTAWYLQGKFTALDFSTAWDRLALV